MCKLNNIVGRISHDINVADHDIIERLNQTTLDIIRLGGVGSCVNKTFTASHGVEEELPCSKTLEVRVLNEPTRLGCEAVLSEVEKTAVTETKGHMLILSGLVSDTGRHEVGQAGLGVVTDIVTSLVEHSVDVGFESFTKGHTSIDLVLQNLFLTI